MSKKIVSFILAICLALSTCVFVSFSEESDKKYVAITFDDGPNDTYFTDTLDLLWKYDALATFFVVGQNVAKYPDELNRVLDEGHEIGLHSFSHANYTNYTIEQVNADIDKCQSAIYDATKTYSSILRLPSLSMPTYFVQRQINYPLIGAKFSSSANVLSGTVADGDIILIHNGIGSANVASDMQNLEAVLQKLTNEGFQFLTVSQLFEKKGVTPVKGTKQYSNVSAPATTTSGEATTAATTGQMGEDGMLINFDDRAYAGYERQQDSTTTTTPANYTSYSVVEETYTNADGESEPCSASGKAFKIAFPTGQTAKYRNACISLKDLVASGISPEATGIKFWAKSIGTTATFDCVGITTASKTKPSKCVTDLEITTEGKYYYLPYATLGVLSGDNMTSYKYLTIYTDLYDMNGKTVYIDNISLYGLGEPVTTTTHYTQTFATSSRTTTRPLQSIKYTEIEQGVSFNMVDGKVINSTAVYGLSEKIPAQSGDVFKISCVENYQWNSKATIGVYDSEDNYLGPIVHNIIYRGDKYMTYTGRGNITATDSSGTSKTCSAYSLGLGYNSQKYHADVTIQIPDTSDEKSIFYGISYIRVKALKYLDEASFYVEHISNEAPKTDTGVNHLPKTSEKGLSSALGNLDGDAQNELTASDILYLRKYIADYDGFVADISNADVNFDGKINLKDVVYFRKVLAGQDGYEIRQDQKFIALSFDDSPGTMPISTLQKYSANNVRGTFMLSATRMFSDYDESLKSLVKLNYDFGNHTSFHLFLGGWGKSEIYNEVNWTQNMIYSKTGQTTKYFRPPYFSVNKYLAETLSDMVFIEGTTSSDTSSTVTAHSSAQTQLSQAKDGNIILLHDNSKLAETLDILIPALLEEGYVICTIDELFKYKGVTPQTGYIYTNVLEPKAIN